MEFECLTCCIRWLSIMDAATRAINAPVIKYAAGEEQLNAVRQAWVSRPNKEG
jgi:hypothetical protein